MLPTRVYLIDDQAMIRAALQALLTNDLGFDVVGSSGDPRAGIDEIRTLKPDVAILDVAMPGLSGLDLIAPLKRDVPGVKVLIASNHEGAAVVRRALAAGADGYLSKDSEASEFAVAVSTMKGGETFVSPRLSEIMNQPAKPGQLESTLDRLTPREREVFQLLAVGKSNKEVAEVLKLSLGTVKKHRENLQRKLDCRSVAELARLAIREGLLTP